VSGQRAYIPMHVAFMRRRTTYPSNQRVNECTAVPTAYNREFSTASANSLAPFNILREKVHSRVSCGATQGPLSRRYAAPAFTPHSKLTMYHKRRSRGGVPGTCRLMRVLGRNRVRLFQVLPTIANATAAAMPPLPAELLSRIFVQCLPDEPYIRPDADRAPLLFTRVCRRWRELALQTTQLWCSLSAIKESGGMLYPMYRTRLSGYAAWLSRSGNRPLSLAVPFEEEMAWRRSQEWVRLLLSYKGRFERLRVVDEGGVDLNAMLDGSSMLKFLSVHRLYMDCRDLETVQPLPSLHTLLIDSDSAGAGPLPNAAWSNLTRLALRLASSNHYSAEEFVQVVSRCPNLQVLVIGPFAAKRTRLALLDAPPETQPPPTHPNLRLLTVVLSDREGFQPVTCALIVPNLLRLSSQDDFEDGWEDAFARTTGSAMILPPPRRFFKIVACRPEDFHMFDPGWTTITHLDVLFVGDVSVFSTVMALCPNLQVLEMTGSLCSDVATSLLAPLFYPSLCELLIAVDAPLGNILETVTLPGLQTLAITSKDSGEHGNVRDMLRRSRCALQALEVRVVGVNSERSMDYWTGEERAELFASVPTLTTLELNPFHN
jgi:hypothetical protein